MNLSFIESVQIVKVFAAGPNSTQLITNYATAAQDVLDMDACPFVNIGCPWTLDQAKAAAADVKKVLAKRAAQT